MSLSHKDGSLNLHRDFANDDWNSYSNTNRTRNVKSLEIKQPPLAFPLEPWSGEEIQESFRKTNYSAGSIVVDSDLDITRSSKLFVLAAEVLHFVLGFSGSFIPNHLKKPKYVLHNTWTWLQFSLDNNFSSFELARYP